MDDSMAICKYFRANLKAHKKDLLAHVDTDKHKKAVKADRTAKSCQKLSTIFIPIYPEKTKIAELKIAAFIAEHDSIQTVDHMTEILPQLDSNSSNGLHTSSIYLCYDFESVAKRIEERDLIDVRERCKNFLVILAEQIQNRLPENLSVLKMMANLDPKITMSQVKPGLKEILTNISRTHVYGVKQDIENEWCQLQNKKWNNLSNTEEFYAEVMEDSDAAGNKRFENVAKFATALLSLPFSNSSVERAFSIYSILKNKLRNRLSPEMLQCLMMVRYTLQRQGSCINFKPTPAMLKKFSYKMYDFKNNNDTDNDCIVMEEMLENINM